MDSPERRALRISREFRQFPAFDPSRRVGVGDPNFVDTNFVDISFSLMFRSLRNDNKITDNKFCTL